LSGGGLVPPQPAFTDALADSLDDLNDRMRAWEAQDEGRRINDRIRTIGQDFEIERSFLAPFAGGGI